jgi:type VI secretion system FHA domain protein
MQLTLEVISPNGELLGSNRRKTVGPEGAQIGRSKECDWVINDQYISRIHARVRAVNGAFYIEGVGRNPLALNDPEQTIPNNEPYPIRHGDRFFLDQYEIRMSLASAAGAGLAIPEDPFSPQAAEGWNPGLASEVRVADGMLEDAGNLDPLAALGGPVIPQIPVTPVDLNQGSVLAENYRPPAVTSPPSQPVRTGPSPGGSVIPDTWDRSGFTHMSQQVTPPVRRPAIPTRPPPLETARDDSVPDTWDKSRTRAEPPTQKLPPLADLVQDAAVRTAPTRPLDKPTPEWPIPGRAVPAQPGHTMRRDAPVATVAATASHRVLPDPSAAATSGALDLEAMLRAAGVPATHMSPEMAAELGQVLRVVVQGLMEVLQSRAEIKSQLRMSMTRMQPTENNPLKFSPNIEAALHTLLVERNRGYLPTVRAFQEALTDIRNHQIAVLQGIRTAFNSMLEQFDPEKFDEELEKQSKRGGLLNLGGKGRFRDYYVEQYQTMARDPDETFKRLFGEFFAQAYEEQMDRLKATARSIGDGKP